MKNTNTHANIAVVGSGLGGLASAATLAARGHKVTLFDKNPWLGGKAAVLHQEGFRFDMGPTILTMPSVLRRIFSEAGKKLEDYLELIDLDPQWSVRQAKLYTRLGMGPCQGRVCGAAVRWLNGWDADSVRPPVQPCRLSSLMR